MRSRVSNITCYAVHSHTVHPLAVSFCRMIFASHLQNAVCAASSLMFAGSSGRRANAADTSSWTSALSGALTHPAAAAAAAAAAVRRPMALQ
jgi:hypothetical protein